jgi:hypothetical protein
VTGLREALAGLVVAVPFLLGSAPGSPADRDVVFRFADPEIIESSGLVVEDGLVVTVNDSGDSARIFTVDLDTGRTVGRTTWDGDVEDVEALAPAGDGELWVGDIGDNREARDSVTVTRVPYGPSERTVAGESFELRYPDGPHDAEALLAHPVTGRLHVVSKDVFGGSVYAAPRTLDPDRVNVLERVGDAPGLVTDGAFLRDGSRLVVRSYAAASVLEYPSFRRVAAGPLPHQEQGEGIAVAPDGRVYLSSEGVRSPLLRVDLPSGAVAPSPSPNAEASPSPDDTASASGAPSASPRPPADGISTDAGDFRRDPWQWLLGGLLGVVALGVLLLALRPR